MNDRKKSPAKAFGQKAIVTDGKNVFSTSFGEGNEFVPEQKIAGDTIEKIKEKETFSLKIEKDKKGYLIKNPKINFPVERDVIVSNPICTGNVQPDDLGLKKVLEKRYFKTGMPDNEFSGFEDNIRIQIIYNILDIEKILAEYITNAVYAIDNIGNTTESSNNDIIGNGKFSTLNTFDQFENPDMYRSHFGNDEKKINDTIEEIKKQYQLFDKFLGNTRFGYFGKAFFYKKMVKDEKTNRKEEKYFIKDSKKCYHILSLISGLRNWVVHNDERNFMISRTWLYNLDANLPREYVETLNYLYDDIANELTKTFSKNSAANVNYIAETLGIKPEIFAEQYFRFSIMKEQKNLGFTLTKLREAMLDRSELFDIRDNHKVFDSIRSKLYTMMDFVIYRYYVENAKKIDKENKNLPADKKKLSEKDIFVINLRGNFSEDQKEKLYFDEAERLWGKLGSLMLKIKGFRGDKVKEYKNKDKVPELKRIIPYGKEISTFSKVMYALTMFLDGKEINDLLTTLINKFDNIQCFIKIMPLVNVKAEFESEYAFFNNSEKIAEELKLIKSFARMGEPVANAKLAMMVDAIRILGTNLKYDEVKKLADSFFNDADGKKIAKNKHGMRNFIINNVINNKRFHYLIRYGNPEHLHEIAKNEAVVRFVLGRIANLQEKQGKNGKNQIDRYYEICIGKQDNKTVAEKIDALTKIIVKMNYDQFEKNRNLIESSAKMPETRGLSFAEANRIKKEFRKNNAEREKFKKIISLYLTVIYHILKNLVNINSRYVIGFHCVERDAQLYKENGYSINMKKLEDKGFNLLTTMLLGLDSEDPKEIKKFNEDNIERAKNTLGNLEIENPKLSAIYNSYYDVLTEDIVKELDEKIKAKEAELISAADEKIKEEITAEIHVLTRTRNNSKKTELYKQINRERAAKAKNKYLQNVKWNTRLWRVYEEKSNEVSKNFRNEAAHLGIVREADKYITDIAGIDNYFELYHYLMQRKLMETSDISKCSDEVIRCFAELENTHMYSKILLKIICFPFGYVTSRYANLSTREQFDINENIEKKSE